MNQTVKLVLYVVLVGALAALGYRFYSVLHAPEPAPKASPHTVAPPPATNDTNIAIVATGNTNAAVDTNNPANTNVATATASNRPAGDDEELLLRRPSARLGQATAYAVALFFLVIGLGVLIARDLSRYFAGKVQDFIFNDNLEGMKDPEYEEAERIWATGDHLEAVRLMRAYLNKHPREQYVALRIAEIYEVNLLNFLAAALEYEEILKKRLPPERWGWAAIHLANLYSGKLDKIAEATQLLHRIIEEYPQTAAAKKARERLGIPEPAPEPSPAVAAAVTAATPTAPAARATPAEADEPEAPPEEKPPSHNLPKGFRPK